MPLPFGILWLDPRSLMGLTSGVLNSQGRDSVTLAVPSQPALIGLEMYWQGIETSPLSLTNLEVTRFTGL